MGSGNPDSAGAPVKRKGPGPLIYIGFPLAMFVLGYSGVMESMGKGLTLFFKYYTEAELQKLEASGFINSDGQAEYVVGLEGELLSSSGNVLLESFEGVQDVRGTGFSDWFVITVDVSETRYIKQIRDRPETRFVLQNRGLWLCH